MFIIYLSILKFNEMKIVRLTIQFLVKFNRHNNISLLIHILQKCFLIISFILISLSGLQAQNSPIPFERISIQNGLSQNTVTCIFQDSKGFMWFGTYDGLNRYDGKNFKVFRHDPENNYSISHSSISAIFEDKFGKLWIGTTGGGLNLYDREKEIFVRYNFDPDDSTSLSSNTVRTICEDRSGNLWIGTWGGGLDLFNREKNYFINYKYNPKNPNSLIDNRVAVIEDDDKGNLWIATGNGLCKYNPGKEQFKGYKNEPSDPQSLSLNDVSTIHIDLNNNIWVGTWGGGLNLFNPANEKFIRFIHDPYNLRSISHNIIRNVYSDNFDNIYIATWGGGLNILNPGTKNFLHIKNNPSDPNSISGDFVYAIYIDNTDILWIGTDFMGINKFDRKKLKFTHYKKIPTEKNTLSHNTIFSIIQDKKGIIWMGTGGGLNRYDIKKDKYTSFKYNPKDPNSLSNDVIRTICEDPSGKIWIGTEIGLNEFDPVSGKMKRYFPAPSDDSSISFHNIWRVYIDKSGDLWVGTFSGGLDRLNRKTNKFIHYKHDPENQFSISDNYIWDILEDKYGNLWIGTDNGGLDLFDRKTERFIHFKNDPNNPRSINDNKIITIFEDTQGTLWLGTTSGLNKYDRRNNSFINYQMENGLPSNSIQSILEDDHGNLWLGTINGLSKFDRHINKFHNYSENNGLQSNEFCVKSCIKLYDGRMIFGGVNGYNIFHPDSIRDNPNVPPIVITKFQLFNQDVPINYGNKKKGILNKSITETDIIRLPHTDNIFSLEFAALNFSAPEKNQYAYKMIGFEENWNYVGNRNFVTYTNLSPGNYKFMVKGSNNDGLWNEEGTSLKIIITPPFWMTAWFRILFVFIIISLFFLGYIYRVNRIKSINKELEQRVQERTIQLDQSNKELESFMYSVSHDLRTPLRAMSGFSRVLLDEFFDKLNAQGKDYLNRIYSASGHMGNLIDDLLKLSRLSRSDMKYEKLDLSNMVKNILESFQKSNPERKANFKISNSIFAACDKGLIEIMLKNLLGNSWKFTSQKEFTEIEFDMFKKDDQNIFFIKDNGIGFDMNFVEKLFEPFQRQNKDFEGTGIGLATVQRIIQRHHGQIWAEGEVNKGSTFYFTLP